MPEPATRGRLPTGGDDAGLPDALAAIEPGARPRAEERLGRRVRRVALAGGRRSSLVLKLVGKAAARKTDLLCSRLLPAAGLGDRGPPLVGTAPGPGDSVWQAFEDLGECSLAADPQPGPLEAATYLVARLHVAFADRPLPAEWSDRLDEGFYAQWTGEAADALEAIRASGLSGERRALRDRLRRRIEAQLAEEPDRSRRLREAGPPATLLHGDLWPQNVMLSPGDRRGARLIDWDRSRSGPLVYDLSTFVSRLSPGARLPALRLYGRAVRPAGWRLPGPVALNEAFDTAERARLASCLISPAEAAGEGAEWGFEDLRTVDAWFAELRPTLPVGR